MVRAAEDRLGQSDGQSQQSQQKDAEHEEAKERSAPSGRIVYKAILSEGEEELERPTSALAWSGLAAGLSMGFSLVAEGLLRAHLPESPWRDLVAKLGYSVGFLIVILGRQQLFTENTLTPILPLMQKKDGETVLNVARLWGVVLAANLLGALLFALAAAKSGAFDDQTKGAFNEIGLAGMSHDALTTGVRAVFAGWLIALMVWLLPFAESGRVWVIIIITWLVGVGHFSHVVAGAVNVFTVGFMGIAGWDRILLEWMLPTLVGNVIGGVMLVAAVNHAQVVAGGGGEDV